MDDPRLDESCRWGVFWIHHETEELRVHHRATIPADDARAVVVTLLASGRVPPLQATLFDLDRLVALCAPCHTQTDAAYLRGRLVITPLGHGRFTFEIIRGADKWAIRG